MKIDCECCLRCHKLSKDCDCCDVCNNTKENCECYTICLECNNVKKECKCCDNCKKYNCLVCENPQCGIKKCLNSCTCKNINGDWKTISEGDTISKNGIEDTYEAVYLVQPDEHWNTNVYKIGRTTQPICGSNTFKRFKDGEYGPYLKIIMVIEVANSKLVEKKLISLFNKTTEFTKYNNKKEYFRGDIKLIKTKFIELVAKNID